MDGFEDRMDSFEKRMYGFDQRLDRFGKRLDGFDGHMASLNRRLDRLFLTLVAGLFVVVPAMTGVVFSSL